MKLHNIINISLCSLFSVIAVSCEDYLDKEPMSKITPEDYYSTEAQLEAIIMDEYPNTLPGHDNWSYGFFGKDNDTDNQIGITANNRYTKTLWTVPNKDDSKWGFKRIYHINFFLSNTLPRYGEDINGSQNKISGNLDKIKHLIGEGYFLRAYQYWIRYKELGDFPIITEPLPDEMETLKQASVRRPRNEVARFILEDLDKAVTLMRSADFGKTRLSSDAALLLKSRVALFEASWLQNFKGTAFVPGGDGWTGASTYPNYQYPAGNIDAEIDYFLSQAMAASKEVGDKHVGSLTLNTGEYQNGPEMQANPYYMMFCDEDMSGYDEIILWRQYARDAGDKHNVNSAAGRGNYRMGLTRGYVQNFLMRDGSPVYTHGTYVDGDGYYKGDKTIADVRANRDPRLSIFLKEPGQHNVFIDVTNNEGTEWVEFEPVPGITVGDGERGYATGYALHKGGNPNRKYYGNGGGYTGCPIFRAAEALLNYIEASYLKNKTIDATASQYWQALRTRAGVTSDYNTTVGLTDMTKEAENDWGAYTAGVILSDKILYNIRRERRCELLSEGFRYDDLRRWRSLDQLIETPSHLEGIHLWNTPMTAWFVDDNGQSTLIADESSSANVSSASRSEYLRPFEWNNGKVCYDGCTWKMAHYLAPLPITQLLLASPNGDDATQSAIYQNPYWPVAAGVAADK